jgi:hypothetical protein
LLQSVSFSVSFGSGFPAAYGFLSVCLEFLSHAVWT